MDHKKQFINDMKTDLILEGVLTEDLADWIEDLIEYKVQKTMDNIDHEDWFDNLE